MNDAMEIKRNISKFILNMKNQNLTKTSFVSNKENSKSPNIILKRKLNTQIYENKNNFKFINNKDMKEKKFLSIRTNSKGINKENNPNSSSDSSKFFSNSIKSEGKKNETFANINYNDCLFLENSIIETPIKKYTSSNYDSDYSNQTSRVESNNKHFNNSPIFKSDNIIILNNLNNSQKYREKIEKNNSNLNDLNNKSVFSNCKNIYFIDKKNFNSDFLNFRSNLFEREKFTKENQENLYKGKTKISDLTSKLFSKSITKISKTSKDQLKFELIKNSENLNVKNNLNQTNSKNSNYHKYKNEFSEREKLLFDNENFIEDFSSRLSDVNSENQYYIKRNYNEQLSNNKGIEEPFNELSTHAKNIENIKNIENENKIINDSAINNEVLNYKMEMRRTNKVYDSLSENEENKLRYNLNFYIDPQSNFKFLMDFIIFLICLYSIIYTPINLIFNNNSNHSMVLLEIFLDFFLFIDFILGFFTAYYDIEENFNTLFSKTFLYYMRQYLIIDIFSIIPFNSIYEWENYLENKLQIDDSKLIKNINKSISEINYINLFLRNYGKSFRILRTLRILKSFKLFRNNIFVKEYISKHTLIKEGNFKIFTYYLSFFLISHVLTCIFIFLGTVDVPNWIINAKLQDASFVDLYLNSLYFNHTTIFTVGYGDILTKNISERIYNIILMIVGIMLYSFALTSISNIIKENADKTKEYNNKKEFLNNLTEVYYINKKLYQKLSRHLFHQKKQDKNKIMEFLFHLPISCRNLMVLNMYKNIINSFNFFKDCKDIDFIIQVIMVMNQTKSIKNDILIKQGDFVEEIYFLKFGIVQLEAAVKILEKNEKKNLKHLKKFFEENMFTSNEGEIENIKIMHLQENEHFGDVLIIENKRSPFTLITKSKIAELFLLSKLDILKLLEDYTEIFEKIYEKSSYNFSGIMNLAEKRKFKKIEMRKCVQKKDIMKKHLIKDKQIDNSENNEFICNFYNDNYLNAVNPKSNFIKINEKVKMGKFEVLSDKIILSPENNLKFNKNSKFYEIEEFPNKLTKQNQENNNSKKINDKKRFTKNNKKAKKSNDQTEMKNSSLYGDSYGLCNLSNKDIKRISLNNLENKVENLSSSFEFIPNEKSLSEFKPISINDIKNIIPIQIEKNNLKNFEELTSQSSKKYTNYNCLNIDSLLKNSPIIQNIKCLERKNNFILNTNLNFAYKKLRKILNKKPAKRRAISINYDDFVRNHNHMLFPNDTYKSKSESVLKRDKRNKSIKINIVNKKNQNLSNFKENFIQNENNSNDSEGLSTDVTLCFSCSKVVDKRRKLYKKSEYESYKTDFLLIESTNNFTIKQSSNDQNDKIQEKSEKFDVILKNLDSLKTNYKIKTKNRQFSIESESGKKYNFNNLTSRIFSKSKSSLIKESLIKSNKKPKLINSKFSKKLSNLAITDPSEIFDNLIKNKNIIFNSNSDKSIDQNHETNTKDQNNNDDCLDSITKNTNFKYYNKTLNGEKNFILYKNNIKKSKKENTILNFSNKPNNISSNNFTVKKLETEEFQCKNHKHLHKNLWVNNTKKSDLINIDSNKNSYLMRLQNLNTKLKKILHLIHK